MYILRMANYKYQRNTLETAMESNPKAITRGLVCEFHAIYKKHERHEISYKKAGY